MVNGNSADAPEARIKTGRRFSAVWLFPIIAAIIAGWLVIKTISEKGPTITISFETAEGLETGKTQVKYKDVLVGLVDTVTLDAKTRRVVVTASMEKSIEALITETARFWVVRPRIGVKEISGLGTLVSGAFIELDPGAGGKPKLDFVGVEDPPVIKTDTPGTKYELMAGSLASISRGSPIYFKGIEVGEVLGYNLTEDKSRLRVHVFVHAPHDQLVRDDTRFWNVSGLQVSLDSGGMQVKTGTLQSLVLGGIEFETPNLSSGREPAQAGSQFVLFETREEIRETSITEKVRFIMNFESSVRGLSVGAPVEFRGIRVGTVVDVRLDFDPESSRFVVPVLADIEPQRVNVFDKEIIGSGLSFEQRQANLQGLIESGFRARLKTGSFLTGQLYVDLDLYPDAPIKLIGGNRDYLEIPTLPPSLQEITNSITDLVAKLQRIPVDTISEKLVGTLQGAEDLVKSPDTRDALASLKNAASELEKLVQNVDDQLVPNAADMLAQANKTLATAEKAIVTVETIAADDSPMMFEVRTALEETAAAAKAIRQLAELLQRDPSALLTGKSGK
jgi:paraquat-inducible protein B